MSCDFFNEYETPQRLLARSLVQEALGIRERPAPGIAGATSARLPKPHGRRPQWSRERCIQAALDFRHRTDKWPLDADWRLANRVGLPGRSTVNTYCGTTEACIAAAREALAHQRNEA